MVLKLKSRTALRQLIFTSALASRGVCPSVCLMCSLGQTYFRNIAATENSTISFCKSSYLRILFFIDESLRFSITWIYYFNLSV